MIRGLAGLLEEDSAAEEVAQAEAVLVESFKIKRVLRSVILF